MVSKISYLELQESMDHEKQFGGFNAAPPQFREITEKEFAQSMYFSYTPEKIEYRQICFDRPGMFPGFLMKNGERKQMIEAHMYFFHDGTGVALSHDFWKGKVFYFAFGCNHDYHEVSKSGLFRCEHAYKCSKCGHEKVVDSSD